MLIIERSDNYSARQGGARQGGTRQGVASIFVKYMHVFVMLFLALSTTCAVRAEPWLDTRNVGLRVDIERLSNEGIITVPINTWPLMWSSILNDLDATDSKTVPSSLHASYARVITAARAATRTHKAQQSVRVSGANQSHVLRHFGDTGRDDAEFSLRRNDMTEHFAYNLEATRVVNPWDGEKQHYDNSYLGFVWGNWIALVGSVERWWGPGWNSNLILSNNARPTLGASLQRNYSEPFDVPVLSWLGPWTTNLFIAKLDDERVINNAKLIGMTVGFRPIPRLEINLRRTAQWGGDGRPETFSNFLELVTGLADNCGSSSCKAQEPGNQLGGIDVRWNLPWYNSALYWQTVGEDEAGGLPSKRASQVGLQFNLSGNGFDGILFIEHDDTSTKSSQARYNVLYNHSIYKTGYRYQGRAIGATWDNDSQVTSLGAVGYLANGDRLEVRASYGELNVDSIDGVASMHSVTTHGSKFNSFVTKWQRPFLWGDIELEGRYTDQQIDQFGRQEDKLRAALRLNYKFD